jgi:hypothetical protein
LAFGRLEFDEQDGDPRPWRSVARNAPARVQMAT